MKFRFPRRVFPALGLVLLISGLIASVVAVLRSTEFRRKALEPGFIQSLSDNFDSEAIDAAKWNVSTGGDANNVSQQSGVLSMTVSNGASQTIANVSSTQQIRIGEAIQEVTVTKLDPGNNGNTIATLSFFIDNGHYEISWKKISVNGQISVNHVFLFKDVAGQSGQTVPVDIQAGGTVKLKVERLGSKIYGFVDSGGGYAAIGQLEVPDGNFRSGLQAVNNGQEGSINPINVQFDNFSAQSLSPITTQTISDDFNEASLDESKWITSITDGSGGSINVQNGKLVSNLPAGNTVAKEANVRTLQSITGDFSASVDIVNHNSTGNESDTGIRFLDPTTNRTARIISRSGANCGATNRCVIAGSSTGGGEWQESGRTPISTSTQVKLTMVRIGTNLKFYYNAGTDNRFLGELSNQNQPDGYIYLENITNAPNYPQSIIEFDNFSAQVNPVETPSPTPTPTPVPPGPITCRDGFSDNFDGADLDTAKWEIATNNNGTVVQSQGQVLMTNPATDGEKFTRFNLKNKISGDFAAELDMKSLATAGNQRNGSLELSLTNYETGGFLRISRYADGFLQSFSKLSGQTSVNGSAVAIPPAGSVKVKIERKGAAARTYYDTGDGQGYRLHTVFQNAFSGDGTLEIFVLGFENFPEVTATVDSFSLRCPPPTGDIDGDEDVDIFDYNLLLEKFGEKKQLTFQDNFDAPAIDGEKWDHNQIIQAGGVLTTTVPAETAETGGYISSKQRLSGNFQIETDMKNFQAKENDPGFATTSELKMWYNGSNTFILRWVKDGGGSYIDYINQLDGVWNDGPNNPIPNVPSLKARLIRNGNTIRGFIDAGNGMTEIFSVPNVYADSEAAQAVLWKAFQASQFEAKTEFDNFSAWSNPPSIGDIDLDGDVDIFDYNLLLEHFGERS